MNEFVSNVSEWVEVDNKINEISEQLKKLKEKKQTIESDILNDIEKKELKEKYFKIGNSKLFYNETYVLPCISFKLLDEIFDNLKNPQLKLKLLTIAEQL